MNRPRWLPAARKYRVRVGHERVSVRCGSPQEAIRLARKELCFRNPRLWDVILTLDPRCFEVDPESEEPR